MTLCVWKIKINNMIIIVKRGRQCKAERNSDIHPISPNTPASQYKPIKVKSSMAKSLPVENLLPQNVGSIINYLQ